MNEVFEAFAKIVGREFAEKWDKDILDSEDNVEKKSEYPKVNVKHVRVADGFGVMLKGGGTLVQLEIRKGVCYTGVAFCWKGDVYNKRKGKSIAFGRLMSALSALEYPDYVETKEFIHSKIGKIDDLFYYPAFCGWKIV